MRKIYLSIILSAIIVLGIFATYHFVLAECDDSATLSCFEVCGSVFPTITNFNVCCPTDPSLCTSVEITSGGNGCFDSGPGCKEDFQLIAFPTGCATTFFYHTTYCSLPPPAPHTDCNNTVNGCKDCLCSESPIPTVGQCTPFDVCSSESEPPPSSSCELQNLICPPTCEIGGAFDISYQYKKTSFEPLLDRQTRKLMFGSWVESYCQSDPVDNNVWYPVETKTLSCDMDDVALGVNVAVRCKARNAMAGMCTLGDQELTCNVQKVEPAIPPAIGYIRVKGPSASIIELRVITEAKALSANNGVIKIRTPWLGAGAADLVPVNDVNASPVHMRTPLGVYSWRKKI